MKNVKVEFITSIAPGGNIPRNVHFKSTTKLRVGQPASIGDNITAVSGVVVKGDYQGNYTLDTTR